MDTFDLDDLEDLFDDLSHDGPTKEQMFKMYGIFLNDISKNPLIINGKAVKYNSNPSTHPICRGKAKAFEHIITRESKIAGKRNFDVERANKIHWIRPIIENAADFRIKYFEKVNDDLINQQFYWFDEKDCIIILREINPDLLLITSFSVDFENQRNYKIDFQNFTLEQKKPHFVSEIRNFRQCD